MTNEGQYDFVGIHRAASYPVLDVPCLHLALESSLTEAMVSIWLGVAMPEASIALSYSRSACLAVSCSSIEICGPLTVFTVLEQTTKLVEQHRIFKDQAVLVQMRKHTFNKQQHYVWVPDSHREAFI